MKKFLMIAAAGLMIAGMSSCKKEYTCECCTTVAGTESCASAKTAKLKKSEAEDACNTGTSSVAGIETKCSIKE